MAQTILSTLISPKGLRIVNEATNGVIFSGLKVKKVEIDTQAEAADIPFAVGDLADGQVSQKLQDADLKSGKVLRPTRMIISAMTDDSIVMSEVIEVFLDVTHTLNITSKSIISPSMVMESVNITQDKDHINVNILEIALEQVQPPSEASSDPAQPADQNSVGVSTVATPDLTDTAQDIYNKVLSVIGDIT